MIALKIKWKSLILCIAIPLTVGGLSAFLTQNSMESFSHLNQPPLAPPAWLFPVVWTFLFILMGIASYLVLISEKSDQSIRNSLSVYGFHLLVNFLWSILFFNLGLYLFSFFWLIFLWILIWVTLFLFYHIRKSAGYLLIPYLLWVSFAGYLNLSIYLLN